MNTIKRLTLVIAWIALAIAATLLFVETVFAADAPPQEDVPPRWTVEVRLTVSFAQAEPSPMKGGDPTEEEPEIDPLVDPELGRRHEGRNLLRLTTDFGEIVVRPEGCDREAGACRVLVEVVGRR